MELLSNPRLGAILVIFMLAASLHSVTSMAVNQHYTYSSSVLKGAQWLDPGGGTATSGDPNGSRSLTAFLSDEDRDELSGTTNASYRYLQKMEGNPERLNL